MSISIPQSECPAQPASMSRAHRFYRSGFFKQCAQISRGRIVLHDRLGVTEFGQPAGAADIEVIVWIHDAEFYAKAALGGIVGAAEAYRDGLWSTDGLVGLMRIVAQLVDGADAIQSGLAFLSKPWRRLLHWLRRNTRRNSRKNIAAHYDLGNDFFSLFLDETMTYSSGIFESENATLRDASLAKLDRVCRRLELSPSDHLLEIGTGWGSFAIHAAKRYGCRVTTTTLSKEQRRFARRRIEEEGLADRITVLDQDYRDLEGHYDRIASIEMIEAVGGEYLGTFFAKAMSLLKPDGLMCLQAITLDEKHFRGRRYQVDFIQRYIFPGGFLPSMTMLLASMTRSTDLRLVRMEDLTLHYARTLHEWRQRFLAAREHVRSLGVPGSFIRLWEFYLAYCEVGFLERTTGCCQLTLARSHVRGDFLGMLGK
ncbi:Cyclopropane-fatty-acyl-phospholipid synthase [Planctomycetes bacterium Pan216]|uniref:Cyclopropane-fatty-acyl-phospholipid synthase n=1 Tax=Kolteria novifilia TaxID=2527975 RepID=A0A518B192_9BACT|nr:Cyclopropane-fatty-acyl-phospholipid synthase [Planctomycetes bacterium Pan216]